jgi:hypothetical protein
MTIEAAHLDPDSVADAKRRGPTLSWWRELAYILVFYGIYTVVRDTQGSASVSTARAFSHARSMIAVERDLFIYHERAMQHAVVGWHTFIRFWNIYYGTAHFVVTAGVMLWLFRRAPHRYGLWRNTLAATTGLALIGFALYPLMPPRLLPPHYGFVDTLRTTGGLWSFDSGAMQKLSNQYAAMPSLHCGWALWCTCALWPDLRRAASRLLAIAYPVVTLYCIVVTGNHYFIDAVGGAAVFGLGYTLARSIRWRRAPA